MVAFIVAVYAMYHAPKQQWQGASSWQGYGGGDGDGGGSDWWGGPGKQWGRGGCWGTGSKYYSQNDDEDERDDRVSWTSPQSSTSYPSDRGYVSRPHQEQEGWDQPVSRPSGKRGRDEVVVSRSEYEDFQEYVRTRGGRNVTGWAPPHGSELVLNQGPGAPPGPLVVDPDDSFVASGVEGNAQSVMPQCSPQQCDEWQQCCCSSCPSEDNAVYGCGAATKTRRSTCVCGGKEGVADNVVCRKSTGLAQYQLRHPYAGRASWLMCAECRGRRQRQRNAQGGGPQGGGGASKGGGGGSGGGHASHQWGHAPGGGASTQSTGYGGGGWSHPTGGGRQVPGSYWGPGQSSGYLGASQGGPGSGDPVEGTGGSSAATWAPAASTGEQAGHASNEGDGSGSGSGSESSSDDSDQSSDDGKGVPKMNTQCGGQ